MCPAMIRLQCLLLLFSLLGFTSTSQAAVVGFNYGTQMSVIPSATQVVNLLKLQHITSIRILLDGTPDVSTLLQALGGTGVQVTLSIPNTQLLSIGQSNGSAMNWVKYNVVAYQPSTNITGIVVGDEVFTSLPNAALVLLPAMRNLYSALQATGLQNQVKISTTLSTTLILDSFPPSQAFFNKTLGGLIQPLLSFLSQTGSYVMLNVNPYDTYKSSSGVISLDYALFKPLKAGTEVVDSNTLLTYTNLFDAVLDSAFFALAKLNFSTLPVVVASVGWPHAGGDVDASADNAATFYSNLIHRVVNNTGTPKRPRTAIPTFVQELFDEDLYKSRSGPATLKHYGLFNSSTVLPNYLLHLTGSGQLLSNDTTNQLYCVAKPGAEEDMLQIALDWVCGVGQANCSAIQPGMLCYEPDTVASHASYAFNVYYQGSGRSDASCSFNGVAIVTTTNPSYGACVYPASVSSSGPSGNLTLSTTTLGNGTLDGNVTLNANSTSLAAEVLRAGDSRYVLTAMASLLLTVMYWI